MFPVLQEGRGQDGGEGGALPETQVCTHVLFSLLVKRRVLFLQVTAA